MLGSNESTRLVLQPKPVWLKQYKPFAKRSHWRQAPQPRRLAKTSKPIAVREVKVVKQETATPAPAVKSQESANHPFHIIVAGGISLKDAEVIANQLKSKGFADAKALNTDGKVRVSISSFNNRDEATKQLLELRKNETYKNAWLLAK